MHFLFIHFLHNINTEGLQARKTKTIQYKPPYSGRSKYLTQTTHIYGPYDPQVTKSQSVQQLK